MATSPSLNIPVSLNLIVDLIKKLPKKDQKKIVSLIAKTKMDDLYQQSN
jgi:hypothetical protein